MREKIFQVSYSTIMSLLMVDCLKMPERPQKACGGSLCPVPCGLLSSELKLICTGRAALSRTYLREPDFDKSINYLLQKLLSTYFLIRMSIFCGRLISTALSANSQVGLNMEILYQPDVSLGC